MLPRIILAAVVGVAVILLCILIGSLLLTTNISIAVAIGAFLKTYADALGVLAALYYGFSSRFL